VTALAQQPRPQSGDIFTIGSGATSVYGVNPQSRQTTGALQQFVVTLTPPLTVRVRRSFRLALDHHRWPYQTVTNSPASGVTINVLGTAAQRPVGLGFHGMPSRW
jgi:hypothetical protein